VAGRQPHPRAGRDRDHRRDLKSVPITAAVVAGSALPEIRMRAPATSTSIKPEGWGIAGLAGSELIATGAGSERVQN
jgi:hypothetical protein